METAVPAETLLHEPAAPSLAEPGLRDPALGILVAVIVSTLLWPVLLLLWIYVLR